MILIEDLRTPSGKAAAATKLLNALGFDINRFYFQGSQYVPGVHDDRSLGYYPAINALRTEFESLRTSPSTWLKFQLPFALPVLEGTYRSEGVIAFVQHVRVVSPRARWRPGQGMRIDSLMNPSGLYAQSIVELLLPGELSMKPGSPPGDVQFKNIERYPEALRTATLRLNQLIAGIRAVTGRSDVPEVLPSDLNSLDYQTIGSDGRVVWHGAASFEAVRMSSGAPTLKEEVHLELHDIQPVGFGRELLESAKFYVSAYNARRAVLDLVGAFEAFVAEAVTPRVGYMTLNTRDQFLRQYGAKLSANARAEIKEIALGPNQDTPRMPSIQQQLKEYKRKRLRPALDQRYLSKVLKIIGIRNDAAHGRPVPPDVLNDLIVAIEAMESLISSQAAAEQEFV